MAIDQTILTDLLQKAEPNALGEVLRSLFWPTSYGCYSNFVYGPEVVELEPESEIDTGDYDPIQWNRAVYKGILCRWYWDGDGILEFHLPTGRKIVNYDCKKSYRWEEL